jgi:hypothetical protein
MKNLFSFKTIIFIMLVILVCGLHLNAAMAGNESPCAFTESCAEGSTGTSGSNSVSGTQSVSLRYLVASGGSYFLDAIGEIHHFLALVESSEINGVNATLLKESLNTCILVMNKANHTYLQLKETAADTPYNQAVINQLMEFDYKKFQKDTGLIPYIFDNVRSYLAAGNVRGIYNQFYEDTGDLLEKLHSIKADLDAGNTFNLSKIWRLNQKCSEYKLFSQYVAEVFYKIN